LIHTVHADAARWALAAAAVMVAMALPSSTAAQDDPGGASDPAGPAAALAQDYGYTAEELDQVEVVRDELERVRGELDGLAQPDDERTQIRAQTRRETLVEHLDADMPRTARVRLVRSLARVDIDLSIDSAYDRARESYESNTSRQAELLDEQLDALLARQAVDRQWLEQARESEEAAADALEDARQLEQAEADETRRRLLRKKRKLAERALESTRDHNEALTRLRADTQQTLEDLSRRKGELLERIETLPEQPTASERRQSVDAVFTKLVELRREAHSQFRDALLALEQADTPVAKAREAVEDASAALNEEKQRRDRFGSADIWELRVEVARMRLDLAEQQLEQARERLGALHERVVDYLPHLRFFPTQLVELLPLVSDQQRDAFFDVSSAQQWEFALTALQNGVRATALGVQEQWRDALAADLAEMDVWVWLWGIVWRLALVVIGIRLLLPILPTIVGRITDALMRFQLVRRHPTATIKLAELSRALLAPLLFYAGMRFLAAYLTGSIPQVEALVWLIDAFFIYWFAVAASRVIIVPRWQRREQGHISAEAFERIDEADASALADLFVVEPERASKLMRSVRVVVVFWLLTIYVPDVVRWVGGVTILWWVVEQVAVWGFIGLVYWVLSQWKDDIASIFEQLASDRMSGVVGFVNRQKDRPWGVLVIALASVYVLLKEIVILIRRYLLSSEWVKRARSFAFRKQIELRKGESDGPTQKTSTESLPEAYVEVFRRPLSADSEFYVDRTEYTQRALDQYDRWREDPKSRGSLILTGEPGVGVTTFITGLERELRERSSLPVSSTRLANDVRTSADVLEVVAGLFGLEDAPTSESALIDALQNCEPRVVILDDCHNTFTRQIEGFQALETLLDITNLCDERHFFVLTFNVFAWNYVNRIYSREHYFGTSMELEAWDETELRQLIESRTASTEYSVSFANLMPDDLQTLEDRHFEVVKTANGYFRYLHEFCGGKPSVALEFWLRSLRTTQDPNTLHVSLFRRPSTRELESCSYDHWFLLSALVQHTDLDAREASEIVNLEPGFCTLALDYFDEERVVEFDDETGRAQLTPLYLQQVIEHLTNSNFLYR
jgi:hypothetical protein